MNQRIEFYLNTLCKTLLLVAIVAIGVYVAKFGFKLSADQSQWGDFGSYLSGVLGVALTAATLAIAVYATVYLPEYLEEKKAAADRVKTALDMSRTLYGRDFYISISAPAWEIAVKWLYWDGADGEEYRRSVCGGIFLNAYSKFKTASEANKHSYQNLIRFGSHFLPYGKDINTTTSRFNGIVDQLSEHQVLVIWLQFWGNLQALLKAGLVDEELICTLFLDWYESWLQFMLELRYTGEYLACVIESKDGTLSLGREPKFKSLPQIESLETVLYRSRPDYILHTLRAAFRAQKIAERTLELHNAAIMRRKKRTPKVQS